MKGDNILTIGPSYDNARGGIAQVMSNYDKLIYDEFNFIANSCDGSVFKKLFCLFAAVFRCICLLLTNSKIKIVHIHTASYRSFTRSVMFLYLAKLFEKNVVMHIHGGQFGVDYNKRPRFIAKSLRRCDRVIALTDGWKNFLETEVGLTNVCVVANVVPKPDYSYVARDLSPVHALFLGLICDNKGVFDLIDVIGVHSNEYRGRLVLHIGGGGEVERCLAIIHQYEIDDIVKFEGWVNGNAKVQLLEQCSLFVLPSYIEAMPMSILEAMSYSMAVISTKVGGVPNIVHDQVSGYIFTPGDKAALHELLISIVNSPTCLESFGSESKKIVESYYPEAIEKDLCSIYTQILND